MDIEILKEFITLSEKLNFSETARIHFITQSVLSKHIQQLEEVMGTLLFHRTRQSVELTNAGRATIEDAKLIVNTWDTMQKKAAFVANDYQSTLSVAFLDAAAKSFLPDWIGAFMFAYPEVMLELKNASIPQTFYFMENRICDMAITIKAMMSEFKQYNYRHLYRDRLCLDVPMNHPLADRSELSVTEIKNERFIAASPDLVSDYQRYLEFLMKKYGIVLHDKTFVDSVEQGFIMIEAGSGVTIVPQHQSYFATEKVVLIPIKEEGFFVDVGIAWRKDNQNLNIEKFLKIVEESSCD